MSEYLGQGDLNDLQQYQQGNQLAAYQPAMPQYPAWWQHPAPGQPLTWQPSTWRAGMPATPTDIDLMHLPHPTADDVERQRQAIYARLHQYGYAPQVLSDQQVLATMAPLPQVAIQWPDWVQDYLRRHPQDNNVGAGRLGVDVPFDTTYEDYNLRNRGLNPAKPTSIGSMYAIPRGALVERYGQAAVDAEVDDWIRRGSTPGAILDIVHER